MHLIALHIVIFSGEVPELRKELATSNESQMKDAVKKVCIGYRSSAYELVLGVDTASEPSIFPLHYIPYK